MHLTREAGSGRQGSSRTFGAPISVAIQPKPPRRKRQNTRFQTDISTTEEQRQLPHTNHQHPPHRTRQCPRAAATPRRTPNFPRPRPHLRPPAQSPPANTNTNTTSVARNRQHVLRSRNAPVQRLGPVRPLPLLVVPRLPPHRARPHGLPRDARGGCRCCCRRGGGARGCGSWGGRRHRREPGVDYIRDGDGDGRGRGAGRGVFPVGEAGVSGWAGVGGEVGLLLPFSSLLWFGKGGGLAYGHANTHPDSPATAHASTTRST